MVVPMRAHNTRSLFNEPIAKLLIRLIKWDVIVTNTWEISHTLLLA